MSIYIRSLMDFHKSHLNLNKKVGVLLPALPKFFQLLTCVGHITFGRTHKQLTWTTNFVLWVGDHLCPIQPDIRAKVKMPVNNSVGMPKAR